MIDLQVIEIRDILPVTGVTQDLDIAVPTLIVTGSDFNNVSRVLVNNISSPEVVILSNTRLLAQIPEGQEAVPTFSVAVISSRLTQTERSIVDFSIGSSPKTIDGFERLIQSFMKILLQTQGSDIFSTSVGGGLIGMLGKPVRSPTPASLVSDFHAAVERTKKQLFALQTNDPTLKLDERLLYARVANARFFANELTLTGRVIIGNQAGRNSVVGMGL